MTDTNLSRRALLATGLASTTLLAGQSPAHAGGKLRPSNFNFEITRTEEEWRSMLTDEEYRILREGGTEAPKSSPLWEETRKGTYYCKGTDNPVYDSEWKVVLDRGWVFFMHAIPYSVMTRIDSPAEPSVPGGPPARFQDGVDLAAIATMEVHCRQSGSHLGHLFPIDGKILHCINGAALTFEPAEA
ncbi:MAG: peptide-methionine (R)-S-oxide reductase [Pseudomonadota bacterium]